MEQNITEQLVKFLREKKADFITLSNLSSPPATPAGSSGLDGHAGRGVFFVIGFKIRIGGEMGCITPIWQGKRISILVDSCKN
jgi:hypothetical protein